MADNERMICESAALVERMPGVRFNLPELGRYATGFAIRFKGKVFAYVNQCAHMPVELDWNEGDFFDLSQNYLVCATHGAHYLPDTGYCVMGPCRGRNLTPLVAEEHDGKIFINLSTFMESLKHVGE